MQGGGINRKKVILMENATTAVTAWVQILTACSPILIALIGIIPTIIVNRKKTQSSIEQMQEQVTTDLKATKKEVADLQEGFNQHLADEEEHRAKQSRYRSLRFYDELCEGRLHRESHFEDVLDDIDFYERYCETHPQFRNSRGKAAMDYIKETYHKVKSKGGFLTHE